MHFTIERQKLLSTLKSIQVVVPARPVLPQTAGFLFRLEHANILTIACTDSNHSAMATTTVNASDGAFNLIIPAHRLLDALALCDGETIDVDYKQWTGRVKITDGHSTFQLGVYTEAFPELYLDFTDRNCICTVSEDWLLKAITGVEFAANRNEELNKVSGLGCVCLTTTKGQVSCIAGSGVAVIKKTCEGGVSDSSNPIPLTSMKIIRGLLTQRNSECSIFRVENRLVFKTAGLLFSTPLKSIPFPNVEGMFARVSDATVEASMKTEDFVMSLKRAWVLNDANSYIPTSMKLELAGNEMKMSAETNNGTYSGSLPITKTGASVTIVLQVEKLMHGCALCGADMTLKASTSASPAFILSEGTAMIIMPIAKKEA